MPATLPPAALRLLEGSIDSFEKLEMIVAMFRATSPRTVDELARIVQLSPEATRDILDELAATGMITREHAGAFEIVRLTPKDDQGAAINELATLYETDRVLVVSTLTKIAMSRIRGMAARTFADAFRLRKGKADDDG